MNRGQDMSNFLEKVYAEINENIKFSEAKNAALITLNSALIVACADKLLDSQLRLCWRVLIFTAIISLFVPLLISIFSFRATTGSEKNIIKWIYNLLEKTNHIDQTPQKYMYYSYISKYYNDSIIYLTDIEAKSEYSILEKQLASQIVDISKVAYRKFILFNIAIKIEIVIFGIASILGTAIILFKLF